MSSRQLVAKQYSKEVSLALNVIGFSPSMVRWRRIHYDTRMKTHACYAAQASSYLQSPYSVFLTGSKQEGTSIWGGGDEDVMIVFNKLICVHDTKDVIAEPGHVHICIEDAENKPGYMFLKKVPFTKFDTDDSVFVNLIGMCFNKNDYLSSQMINKLCYYISKVCEKTTSDVLDLIYYINERTPLHKKTVTFETSDEEYPSMVCRIIGYGEHTVDIVFGAFTCSEPTTAINEWARRKRYYDWPSKTVVDHIVNMPSYVVPKGFKGSESRGLEFRISYTLSELQLIKALNEMQLKVYILLKLLFQSEVEEQFPDIITSYCLKNVVFWLCEKAPENQFVAESLLEWLTKGLIYILDCIKEEYLPMYLMPKRNLLEGKLDKDNKLRFKKLLTDLIKEGPKVIERVRKIKSVVETLRSNVVVAMAMGYMLHRGEMFLVNNRDETLKDIGPRVIPAWMEMFFTALQQANDPDAICCNIYLNQTGTLVYNISTNAFILLQQYVYQCCVSESIPGFDVL